jgi:hypothetical protein
MILYEIISKIIQKIAHERLENQQNGDIIHDIIKKV